MGHLGIKCMEKRQSGFTLKRLAAAALLLLALAIPAPALKNVFSKSYHFDWPPFDGENVTLVLDVMSAPAVVRKDSGTTFTVYTRADTALRITKAEERGGYAYGVSYWVNDGDRANVLYSNNSDGSVDLLFKTDGTLKIRLYRYVLAFRDEIEPLYTISARKDTIGPTISLAPEPGSYQSATIVATPADTGAGMAADLTMVTTYTVQQTSPGETVRSGTGIRVPLEDEGVFLLSFTATDLLGNAGTSPPAGGPLNTYTIDHSPPICSDAAASVEPRQDGSLDASLQFTLSDPGVGVDTATLAVEVSGGNGATWSFGAGALSLSVTESGGVIVSLPTLVVQRSARLGMRVEVEDRVGNALTHDSEPWIMPPRALEASVRASKITAEAFEKGSALAPRYRIPVCIDQPLEDLLSEGVRRYHLTRRIAFSGAIESVRDLPPSDFAAQLADVDGSLVYWDVLEDACYAHQSLSYEIETVFSANGSEIAPVTGVAPIPNLQAWQVDLCEGGRTLQAYRSTDAEAGAVPPEVPLDSFNGLKVRIGPDPEGDALAMRLVYTDPNGDPGTVPAGAWTSEIALDEAISYVIDGTYRIRFVIVEEGTRELPISPEYLITLDQDFNMIAGPVVWSRPMLLSAPVVIKDGGALLVTGQAEVSVTPGDSITLTVRPGGSLQLETGGIFQPQDWMAGQQPGNHWGYWGGIVAAESQGGRSARVVICGMLRGAVRGVTAMSASDVTIQGATVEQCRTGVHAIGADADPIIDRTSFIANARYGIKEDLDASPVVTDCRFDSNTYDYYDEDLTVMDAAGINDLPGNSGNTSAEAMP
jgi:hypothetical protein